MPPQGSRSYPIVETQIPTVSTNHEMMATLNRTWMETGEQLKTALPTLAGMVLYKIPWLISLRFVGGIGAAELAAAALASTLCNVTGMSLSVGLSSALTTITGQARGNLQAMYHRQTATAKNINGNGQADYQSIDRIAAEEETDKPLLPLVFLYRGLLIQLLFVLPVGIWWLFGVKSALVWLGQTEELSEMTDVYLRILTPGLWSYSVNWTLTAWLQAMELADIPAYAAAIGLVLHIPFNHLFIYELDLGYIGCAMATVLFQLIQPIMILIYLFGTQVGRRRALDSMYASTVGRSSISLWKELRLAASSLSGIIEYLGLAVPGIIVISEWWASEIAIFLSGRFSPTPDLALGAMTLYQSINTFCFMFPVAWSVSCSTRVAKFLGAGDAANARFSNNVSAALSVVTSGTIGLILYSIPHTFLPSLFAPTETDLSLETSKLISLLSLYVFADGIQSVLNGTMKGCGRQVITMPIVVVAYWVVGLPLAYYLAFVRCNGELYHPNITVCGDVALVAGMTVGTWLHMILLVLAVFCATDWKTEAIEAMGRLDRATLTQFSKESDFLLAGEQAVHALDLINP